MKPPKNQEKPLINPEVVFNLWAYADEDGNIMRLAGKTYVMDGSDEQKLALLRQLSATDFLSATWIGVPKRITVSRPDGQMHGIAHAAMLADPISHGVLFEPLLKALEKALPDQVRCEDGTYVAFQLDRPQAPLCITTVVMEYADGRLVPLIKPSFAA